MDIRQLRCFLAAANHLNFTKAAAELYLTQSGVSYQITALEASLGFQLFHRSPRSVRLTEAGAIYLEGIRGLLEQYDEILLKSRLAGTSATGKLTLGLLGGYEMKLLPGWLDAFSRRYPKVEVKLSHYRLAPLQEALAQGEVDLAFTMLFEGDRPPQLAVRPLFLDHSVVVMRRDHPLATRTSLCLADLKDQVFVAMDSELGSKALEWRKKLCRKRGFHMQIVQVHPTFTTLFMAVEAGVGISVHAQQVVEELASPRLHQVPLEDEDCRVEFAAVWRKEAQNPNLGLFLQGVV